jgi:hypothetical protein
MLSYIALGQNDDAAKLCRTSRGQAVGNDHLQLMLDMFDAVLTDNVALGQHAMAKLVQDATFSDPEGWYYWAQAAALLKDHEFAFNLLRRSVTSGFHCPRALETSPLLDPLRGTAAFAELLTIARHGHDDAAAAFASADGARLLGLPRT